VQSSFGSLPESDLFLLFEGFGTFASLDGEWTGDSDGCIIVLFDMPLLLENIVAQHIILYMGLGVAIVALFTIEEAIWLRGLCSKIYGCYLTNHIDSILETMFELCHGLIIEVGLSIIIESLLEYDPNPNMTLYSEYNENHDSPRKTCL
ncbi:hypothetical protein ACJX0J_018622, partial [Zea mays]